ncbi:TPA: hypothetical protein ACOEOC_000482 [Stenotrophomonas maltophilia]|uniref:Uncharacterized protein n=1 Tax=Stenotrophomonas maltophilia TaxID=40324 RepID=A0AAI9CIP8_STEMA|nr:hypothetical protein [Stenotrophomonas maltophilia]EKZ1926206.1 hypothetical protein [Stenotrophomonas maltophilia]EMB2743940.1 hypothetical protein [Stenotrophomonas maltophilia]MBH1418374.1 hypothetical protein [Stenotrophomonas maltophilia]MBH1685544.1 hypothetical protein [Stenotrophomonas maltophilia]MBH1812776.1 hypothetical protein [Stenotrophomonas maltophilia]
MNDAQIEALGAALATEQATRAVAVAGLAARIDGSTGDRIDRLVGIIEQQGKQIAELAMHVGLLVQAVAQLLGEEAGTPVHDEGVEPERVDLDGNPY